MKKIVYMFIIGFFGGIQCAQNIPASSWQRGSLPQQSPNYITNPPQYDGFGSQFQSIIAAVVYAELHNKKFVYTPFSSMEHNYTNDPAFIEQKEQFINFINNFNINTAQYSATSTIAYKSFFDAHIDSCAQSKALQKIKKIFRQNKRIDNYFNNNNLNIVLHVRRHNAHDNRIAGTNTPDDIFLRIMHALRTRYAHNNPMFHICSQGDSSAFEVFQKYGDVVVHLNEAVEDTFLTMVLADVLVTSPSSFSYTAALLSEGTVYYIPFWHKPLPHWISVDALVHPPTS